MSSGTLSALLTSWIKCQTWGSVIDIYVKLKKAVRSFTHCAARDAAPGWCRSRTQEQRFQLPITIVSVWDGNWFDFDGEMICVPYTYPELQLLLRSISLTCKGVQQGVRTEFTWSNWSNTQGDRSLYSPITHLRAQVYLAFSCQAFPTPARLRTPRSLQ